MYNKRTFLIDSENIGAAWKSLLTYKEKRDRIIVFYTDKTPNLSYTDLLDILQYPDEFESIKCYTGKDALDFQLVSYLGYLLKSSPKTDYYIVSKDTGYDSVCKFWCDMDPSISLQRIDTAAFSKLKLTVQKKSTDAKKLSTAAKENTAKLKENVEESDKSSAETAKTEVVQEAQETIQIIKDALPDTICEKPDMQKQIVVILQNTNRSNLQQLYLKFLKSFGHETGSSIYRDLKPHLTQIYETLR